MTDPNNSALATTAIDCTDTLAMVPSPAPTMISPLGNNPRVLIPRENSFLIGPNLL